MKSGVYDRPQIFAPRPSEGYDVYAVTRTGDTSGVDLDRFARLSVVWSSLGTRSARWASRDNPTVLSAMFAAQQRIVASGGWTHGPSNLMSVLGLARLEVLNCRAASWLFDPMGRHRIGGPMVKALADLLGLRVDDPAHASVATEVIRLESRADIVVTGPAGAWKVVIEAKIDAAEGDKQAERLEKDWPEPDVLIFLTTAGDRIPITANNRARWVPLSWAWLADTTIALLDESKPVSDARAIDSRHAAIEWAAAARRSLR